MKFPLMVLASLTTAALLAGGDGETSVTFIGHEKVAAALAKNGPLVSASDLIVQGAYRSEAGKAELHEKQTDVYYVADGAATFVTGGVLLGDKVVSPGQHQGSGIQGGEFHHLSKGDVVVIPAGVPHWFRDVPHSINYFLIKVEKP